MYLALYRKYRPQTFADVISQEHITTTLTNQLKNGQVAHAYLFTGSRGTGKTTCAKILAKAVNCVSLEDGNPCLKCEMCKIVDEGVSDVLEIDAASNNGVDAVRALRDEAMYSPVSCKYRVYIIDEVHMLSTAAFNALLKLIEEPPAHVIFILATTEVHKIPATIISRCQRFEFRRIDIRDSAARLTDICMTEGAEISENAAYLIAKLSDGGMRDALSLLDQCISVNKRVSVDIVRECAGVAGNEHLFALADCVAAQNTAQALDRLTELIQAGKDISRLIEELISHYRNLMLLKINSGTEKLVSALPEDIALYNEQNKKYTLGQIMRSMTILGECLEALSRNKQRSVTAEMCIIKLCTPKLDTDTAALSQRIERLEQMISGAIPTPATAAIQRSSEIDEIVSHAVNRADAVREKPTAVQRETINAFSQGATDTAPQAVSQKKTDEITQATATAAENAAPSFIKGAAGEIPQAEPPIESTAQEITSELLRDTARETAGAVPQDEIATNVIATQETPNMPTQDADEIPPPEYYGEAVPDYGMPPEPTAYNDTDEPIQTTASESIAQTHTDVEETKSESTPKAPSSEFTRSGDVREWADIIEELPFSIRVLIGGTNARYNGDEIIVDGTPLAKSFVSGEYNTQIRDSVQKALGAHYTIVTAPDVTEEQHDRVSELLTRAEQQGIAIKRK